VHFLDLRPYGDTCYLKSFFLLLIIIEYLVIERENLQSTYKTICNIYIHAVIFRIACIVDMTN